MAKGFTTEQALSVIRKTNKEENNHYSSDHTSLYKDYYSLETGEPISFDQISKRIIKRFADIERSSAASMLDLFFLHQNWNGFYKRDDSFSKYIKESLQISRTHAYGVINSVRLLNQYYSNKGDNAPALNSFLDEIASSIEGIGIKKLIIISGIKDAEKKFILVEKLLNGTEITADELESRIERRHANRPELTINNNVIIHNGIPIISIDDTNDKELINYIYKTLSRYLSKRDKKNG